MTPLATLTRAQKIFILVGGLAFSGYVAGLGIHYVLLYSDQVRHPVASYTKGSFLPGETLPDFNITLVALTGIVDGCNITGKMHWFNQAGLTAGYDFDIKPQWIKSKQRGNVSGEYGFYWTTVEIPLRYAFDENHAPHMIMKRKYADKCTDSNNKSSACGKLPLTTPQYKFSLTNDSTGEQCSVWKGLKQIFVAAHTDMDSGGIQVIQNVNFTIYFLDLITFLNQAFPFGVVVPSEPSNETLSSHKAACQTMTRISYIKTYKGSEEHVDILLEPPISVSTNYPARAPPWFDMCQLVLVPYPQYGSFRDAKPDPITFAINWYTAIHAVMATVLFFVSASPSVPWHLRWSRWWRTYRDSLYVAVAPHVESETSLIPWDFSRSSRPSMASETPV